MKTRRNHNAKRSKKNLKNKNKTKKRWETAITAADKTLSKTGSIQKARKAFKLQALANARKLFGYSTTSNK